MRSWQIIISMFHVQTGLGFMAEHWLEDCDHCLYVAGLLWDDRLSCQHCHREMKNEHSLNVHISRYHNLACVPAQAVCPVCSKTYSNQYSLRTHMHLQAAGLTLTFHQQNNLFLSPPNLGLWFIFKIWILKNLKFLSPAQRSIVSSGSEEERQETWQQ